MSTHFDSCFLIRNSCLTLSGQAILHLTLKGLKDRGRTFYEINGGPAIIWQEMKIKASKDVSDKKLKLQRLG